MSCSSPQAERQFDLKELFFSITDINGRIINGNEVFTRVSGYSWEELNGKPHSIIRHPDMPRVVFQLLWDTIKAGDNIAAYVKNQAKDGSYYWVMAYVSPTPNGFLSVRFKPTSPLLKVVEQLYQELRKVEQEIENKSGAKKEAAIAASKALLVERLKQLGFSDYNAFISKAMVEEFNTRLIKLQSNSKKSGAIQNDNNQLLRSSLNTISKALYSVSDKNADFQLLANGITEAIEFISSLSVHIELASLNLTIKSIRHGESANPLCVISSWLRTGSLALGKELTNQLLPVKEELARVQSGLFSLVAAQLQIEMILFFLEEMELLDENKRGYSQLQGNDLIKLLSQKGYETFKHCIERLNYLRKAVLLLASTFRRLEQEVVGLSLAHINGRVECSRLPESVSLEGILNDVITRISNAREILDRLSSICLNIGRGLNEVCTEAPKLSKCYESLNSSHSEAGSLF